ncbi:lysophospholipid acyltransferase family protein [Sulfurimonas sp. MAG313]|nr:lysophospholipid acyltransferase family protein [Sulfurimonas sp. MAG313]
MVLIPFIGSLLIRLIYMTTKRTFHPPKNIPDEPCVIGFWHGDLLMQPFSYFHWKKDPKIAVMISDHFDGEILARTMSYFGLETVRGSSRKGAARALIQAIKKVKDGYDLGLTPDGPKGPRFSMSDGVVAISQKADCYIVLQTCVPDRYWQLGSWDKFVIPKPFSHIHFYCEEPFKVTGMDMEEAKQLIHDKLMKNSITT